MELMLVFVVLGRVGILPDVAVPFSWCNDKIDGLFD